MTDGNNSSFSGEVGVFYTIGSGGEDPTAIYQPVFKEVHGRTFVVGKSLSPAKHPWSAGKEMGVAWDRVSDYLVFDSIDDYSHRVGWKVTLEYRKK